MDRKAKAVELFAQRFNCSQSVFTAFRQADRLDEETALKVATVFGAGVACSGSGLCGAVSGALLAISMKHGRGDLASVDAKLRTYELGRQLMADFASQHGSCVCRDILGVDIGTEAGFQQAEAAKLFETRCLDVVKTAADLLEPIV
jgi:C_GCAxxG_C_C family probable redox protein